ncbi:hypothetical protein BDN72DRAFT_899189 [Pluteus cervinus]|uniref:Uncharacterized protein n=1 Tax=Pluteus cervinus TaxID=181527 RepID=A0ACD3ANU8_9AGAR|nr:hypothetical protein BDN72DRAFT_899189 [Pluteus cervinus]
MQEERSTLHPGIRLQGRDPSDAPRRSYQAVDIGRSTLPLSRNSTSRARAAGLFPVPLIVVEFHALTVSLESRNMSTSSPYGPRSVESSRTGISRTRLTTWCPVPTQRHMAILTFSPIRPLDIQYPILSTQPQNLPLLSVPEANTDSQSKIVYSWILLSTSQVTPDIIRKEHEYFQSDTVRLSSIGVLELFPHHDLEKVSPNHDELIEPLLPSCSPDGFVGASEFTCDICECKS